MKIIAGNFKCNLTRKETKIYLQNLDCALKDMNIGRDYVYIFPPSSALLEDDFAHVSLGVQNAYGVISGAFTGEIGLAQIDEFSIKSVIIGHSERRSIFKEDQNMLIDKFNFYKERGFKIFYCIGEDMSVREKGALYLEKYLLSELKGIDTKYNNLIIAYEPIWAIGSGVVASLSQIKDTHQIIKNLSNDATLLYGGSVNVANAKDILNIQNVDGVLIGGASLKWENIAKIIEQSK